MKYGLYNWLKIRHYESAIQDVDAAIKTSKEQKKKNLSKTTIKKGLLFIKN